VKSSASTGGQPAQKEAKKNVSPTVATPEPPRYTGDMVVEKFEGKGIGKKTLAGICQELNLDCTKVKQKLDAKKMLPKDDETLKEAATRMGLVPIELLKIVLVGEVI
jgi:hypothetical protein